MPRRIPRTLSLALATIALAVTGEWFLAAVYGGDQVSCGIGSFPMLLREVPEASGLTPSRRHADLFWTFNDSGDPALYGIDANGDLKAHVQVAGAASGNWEDISIGPCGLGEGSCLYIADIGDNKSKRASIRVFRVPEPRQRDRVTAAAQTFEGRYPDGPHDAEAAFVLPDGRLFVVTKDKYARVYRFPLEAGRVSTLVLSAILPLNNVTDADASEDGTRVAVRTKEDVVFYRTSELLKGDVEHGDAVSVGDLGEPQGEGVAFGAGGVVMLAGEGGGKKKSPKPGTFAALQCHFSGA